MVDPLDMYRLYAVCKVGRWRQPASLHTDEVAATATLWPLFNTLSSTPLPHLTTRTHNTTTQTPPPPHDTPPQSNPREDFNISYKGNANTLPLRNWDEANLPEPIAMVSSSRSIVCCLWKFAYV